MDVRLEPGGHRPQLSPNQRGVASGTLRTDRGCGPGGGGPTSQAPRHSSVHLGFNGMCCGHRVLCGSGSGSTALGTGSFPSELLYKWKGDKDTEWC